MARKQECKLTCAFCRSLEAQGALCIPLVGGNMSMPGVPDRYVAHTRWSGFLEMKGHERKVDARQQHVIDGLRARGVAVFVLRFSEETGEYFRLEWEGVFTEWYKWGEFFNVVEKL